MKDYIDFKAFRSDVEKALEDVAKKYGIKVAAGNVRYGDTDFTLQLKGERTDVDVEKVRFDADLVYMSGFQADDYKRVVTVKGKSYTIIGFKPGNKYDVRVECSDGNNYAVTSRSILAALGRKAS